MNTAHPSPARYAVLRVEKRKAKAKGAIAAASAHQLRQRPTTNADADGPAPIIMHLAAGATPYQAASALLDGAERRNCTTVLAREIVLSASAGYFRPGREQHGGEFLADRVKAWASAALEWAKRTWPDQLASFVVHLDEMTPHAHLLCVPRERKPDGGWKLNSKKFFDKERLRDLQTSYGDAMAPLGIRRGEPGSAAKHSEVKQFYGALQRARALPMRPIPPAPPKRPTPATTIQRSLTPILAAIGVESDHEKEEKAYATARQKWLELVKEHRQAENQQWADLRAAAVLAPLVRKQEKGAVAPLRSTKAPAQTTRKPIPGPR